MKQKSLKLNFIMNALLTMSSFIFPLITFPYVSRILLPVGTGKVDFANSFVNYFNMIAQLGIPTYGIRACARVRDNKEELTRVAHELLFINLIMNVISYSALIIAILTVPRLQGDRTLFIIFSFTLILNSIGMEWLYKSLEQYTYITIRSILFKFIALIAMFLLIHNKSDYVIYGGITIFAASASNILNFLNAHKYIGFKPVGNYKPQRHLKAIFVFFAMTIATTIYTNLDSVMLGFMKTDADVGYYTASIKIKNILVSVVTSLGTVLLPRASYYIQNGNIDQFKRLTKKAFNFVILLAMPLMVYFMLFAKQGIFFLSGDAYADSIMPMRIIMPTLLFIGVSNITGIQILVPTGNEKGVLISEIAGAITDLVINIILIPPLGAAGAAIGTLAAELVVVIVQYVYVKDIVPHLFNSVKYYKNIIAILLAILGSFWMYFLNLGNFITLAISAILYFGIYAIVLLIMKESLFIEIYNQVIFKILKNDKLLIK